jgi:hypothetical protein
MQEANNMSDDSLIPLSDEQAKLAQQILQTGKDAGGYLADLLGDLPRDLVGLLVGDRVKVRRAEKIAIPWSNAKQRLLDRGINQPEPPSLKLELPILEAAADEDNDQLRDLWARLLAATMDPKRRDFVRQAVIRTVKQRDPMDAIVFKLVQEHGQTQWTRSGRDAVASRLGCSINDVLVSFSHLATLDCVCFTDGSGTRINPYLTPFGTLLMNSVSG